MEIIINENNELKRQLVKAMETNILQESGDKYEVQGLLKILLECAKFNANRKPGGIRYTTTIKELVNTIFNVSLKIIFTCIFYLYSFVFTRYTDISSWRSTDV